MTIDPKTSALLVMDFQRGIVEGNAPDKDVLLARTAELIAKARSRGVKIVYVVVGFRPGYPEVSERNQSFKGVRDTARFAHGTPETEIHPAVAPAPEDVVVTKHRVGAFLGTDLDMVLRANDVETIVISGISTSGVILSTLRYAADADYRIVVVSDCCSDVDPDIHRFLMERLYPRQSKVMTAAELF